MINVSLAFSDATPVMTCQCGERCFGDSVNDALIAWGKHVTERHQEDRNHILIEWASSHDSQHAADIDLMSFLAPIAHDDRAVAITIYDVPNPLDDAKDAT